MNSETPAALSEVSNEKKDASIADGPSKKDTSLMLTAQPLPPVEPRSLVVSTPPIDPQPAGATPSEVEIRAKEPPPSRPQRRLAARTPRNLQPPPPLPTEEECRTQLQVRSQFQDRFHPLYRLDLIFSLHVTVSHIITFDCLMFEAPNLDCSSKVPNGASSCRELSLGLLSPITYK